MDGWDMISELRRQGERFVVATITSQRGSVPADAGAKALVTKDGLVSGTLGGGKIEAMAIRTAMELLESGAGCLHVTWNLQRDVGMTCGGELSILFEVVKPAHDWHIVVFGAGHVSQALVRLLASLRCTVDVVDVRADWLDRLPSGERVRLHRMDRYEDGVELVTKDSFVVSITMGHSTDRPVLAAVLGRFPELPYVGVIGSASKRAVILRDLQSDGLTKETLQRLTCPIGLPIGSNDPAEIAVSIAAQLIQTRDGLMVSSDPTRA